MCSEIFFDRYFKFSLSDEEISQNDIKLILASGNNYEKLFFKITELNASNKILSFLTIFPDHIEKIEKKNIELFVTVLLDLGDSFPKDESLISETDVRIHFLMKSLLAKLDSQEERFKVLKNSPTIRIVNIAQIITDSIIFILCPLDFIKLTIATTKSNINPTMIPAVV